ncbi:MAG: hypothetical protein KBD78_13925 [Oligoflexales bacterium]|nr:hypothetical protein [Oligoflexales bacterium]
MLGIFYTIYTNTPPALAQTPETLAQNPQAIALTLDATTQNNTGIHPAPVTIIAKEHPLLNNFSLHSYRAFAADSKGNMQPIPFQIDEKDPWSDYILPKGKENNQRFSNGIFDNEDELVFMGKDVGSDVEPSNWGFQKPSILFKINFTLKSQKNTAANGAIFVGIYFQLPPKQASSIRNYVVWNEKAAEVTSSRYRYRFDPKNYLVVRGIDVGRGKNADNQYIYEEIISSSTFALNIDLKYFVTVSVDHRDLDSKLDAYKAGPIRNIIRVSFTYKFLNINFELGMYTEVSFFENAVFLPAVLYNPVDGTKRLNKGSGFYYGFNFKNKPSHMGITSNMPKYDPGIFSGILSRLQKSPTYWLTGMNKTEMIYMEVKPSEKLLASGSIPYYFEQEITGTEAQEQYKKSKKRDLGSGPINMAMYFDLTKFTEGDHMMAFQLFFENQSNSEMLEQFKKLDLWASKVNRVY